MIHKRLKYLFLLFLFVPALHNAAAQHTLGFSAGYGTATARFFLPEEMKSIGAYTAGLSWRYYSPQRVVGGFGVDLEFLQQGFSFAMNASAVDDKADYLYYTRRVNSIVLPIVWQPHFYMLNKRVRVYLEAAATFSYHLSSTYENETARDRGRAVWRGGINDLQFPAFLLEDAQRPHPVWQGTYNFKPARDNRLGYGLAGGGGIAFLIRRFEINARVRYYFGLADIIRNRNQYADNATDGSENPFRATPLRAPMDNLTFSIGVSYRFNKEGFSTWAPRPKRAKNREVFKYEL